MKGFGLARGFLRLSVSQMAKFYFLDVYQNERFSVSGFSSGFNFCGRLIMM